MLVSLAERRFAFVDQDVVNVLAVDDDPIHREFASVYLAGPSTTVVTADCAEAGLEILQDQLFDIALVDVDMPGMSGIDLVQRLRSDTRYDDMPILVITGREDMLSIDRAYDAGATAFICKPVNWRLLCHQVKFMLRAHKALRRAEASDA